MPDHTCGKTEELPTIAQIGKSNLDWTWEISHKLCNSETLVLVKWRN